VTRPGRRARREQGAADGSSGRAAEAAHLVVREPADHLFPRFAFVDPIFTVLVQPLLEAGHDRMIFTGVMEAFFTRVKVAFFAAIMISFPVLATQLWLFIAPGLYKQERRRSCRSC
jgi:Sec-independent protein secretion pathway component TatC